MACVREGQVPGTELAADSVSWQGNARGLCTVSEQDLSGSAAETQGLISLLPQWVYPALVLEALHERLQFQPGNDKSNMPGRKQTAAPGNQEGRIRCLDPRIEPQFPQLENGNDASIIVLLKMSPRRKRGSQGSERLRGPCRTAGE
ncbi:hypothetical protein mRhiFer1_009733 [Rhinolophus ferrumequinum]|uniref:Uncharacterized protein n=1 Tax=Rhinolophus ferrumequinum TaxID=59479 RepID=A0A7J7ZCY4_RHIFE|nr:hypothetical protein mRhiFer1_009733 [Rhinolophus ferrumequinum]